MTLISLPVKKKRTKSIIDKKNKLWRWKKADNKFRYWYRDIYGLEAKEIGIMTTKGWNLYKKLFLPVNHKGKEV